MKNENKSSEPYLLGSMHLKVHYYFYRTYSLTQLLVVLQFIVYVNNPWPAFKLKAAVIQSYHDQVRSCTPDFISVALMEQFHFYTFFAYENLR